MRHEAGTEPIRVLILEDDPRDAALIIRALEHEGLNVECRLVDKEQEYVSNLAWGPDIILADYTLPRFDALGALEYLKRSMSEIPLIVVSGSIGEDLAVEAIREGASDYLLKDRLGRLGKAVLKAIAQSKLERQAKVMDRELAQSSALAGEIGLALTSESSLRESLGKCADSMVRNLDAAFARIWTFNKAHNMLELEASASICTQLVGLHGNVPVGKDRIGLIAQECKPYLTNDAPNDPRVNDKEWAIREGIVSFAGYPLLVENQVVGVVAMFSKNILTDFAVQAMGSVANHIALGIRRRRDHEALLESNRTLESLLNASPLAVISLDSEGKVRFWNRAAERVFGWRVDEVIGGYSPIVEPDDTGVVASHSAAEASSGIEWRGKCKDGHSIDINVWSETIRTAAGDSVGSVEILADISQRKLAERSLQEAKEAAEAANELKSRLLANMSHELRTPLTAILGYADFLKQRLADDPEGLEDLDVIERNGQNLLELISDVLDLSMIETERLELARLPCSPAQTIDHILRTMQLPARAKNIVLVKIIDPAVPQVFISDPMRLRQALSNLVGNAIKFTERGSIKVLVQLKAKDGIEYIEFRVKDTGIGIPKDKLQCLFKPFTQVDPSLSRKYGGSGLGLVISYKIAQLLGGNLIVESEVNVGSEFCLYIPYHSIADLSSSACVSQEGIASSNSGSGQEGSSGRILVVDDSKSNQSLLRRYLEQAGHKVCIADDGSAAIETCAKREFDLIFMDIQMPVLDGFQALACLRREGIDTPIIALTAHSLKGDRESCLNAGFTSYLSKPVTREDLLRCLKAFMKREGGRSHGRHALEH